MNQIKSLPDPQVGLPNKTQDAQLNLKKKKKFTNFYMQFVVINSEIT